MNKNDFARLVRNFTEDEIHAVQPYVNNRCVERGVSFQEIVSHLLNPVGLEKVVEDRVGVFKLYFRVSNKRQFEVIAEVSSMRIIVRTVILLNKKFRIKCIRRRF